MRLHGASFPDVALWLCPCAALGGLMFRVLVLTKQNQWLQILCVVIFQVTAYWFVRVWLLSCERAFADERSRIAFDFMIRFYMRLFTEMVFIQLNPGSVAYILLFLAGRSKDFVARSGLVHEYFETDGVRLEAKLVRFVGSAPQRVLRACTRRRGVEAIAKAPAELHRARAASMSAEELLLLWYRRWKQTEQLMLGNVLACLVVMLSMIAEKVLVDRGAGLRVLTMHIPEDSMWKQWISYSAIAFAHVLVFCGVMLVYRQRLMRLKFATLHARRVAKAGTQKRFVVVDGVAVPVATTADAAAADVAEVEAASHAEDSEVASLPAASYVDNPLAVTKRAGSVAASIPGAVSDLTDEADRGGAADAKAASLEVPPDIPHTSSSTGSSASGSSSAHATPLMKDLRQMSALAVANGGKRRNTVLDPRFEFHSSLQKFFFQDPVVFPVAITCCVLYTISVVYSIRLLELTGKLH